MSGPNLEDVAYDAAVQAVEEIDAKEQSKNGHVENTCTLDNGIVLRIRKVNPLLVQSAARNVPEPEVPLVYIKDDDKWIPNYDNPQYIRDMVRFRSDQQMAVIDAGYLMGTEVVSVPEGVDKPDDDGWMDRLEFLGVIDREQTTQSSFARYLAWLKYYAISSNGDIDKLTNATMRAAGVEEEDVNQAVATFQNRKERRANRKGATKASD